MKWYAYKLYKRPIKAKNLRKLPSKEGVCRCRCCGEWSGQEQERKRFLHMDLFILFQSLTQVK